MAVIYNTTEFEYSDIRLTYNGTATIPGSFTGDAVVVHTPVVNFSGFSNLKKDITRSIFESLWTPAAATGSYNDWTNPEYALVDDEFYAEATQSGAGSKRQSYHNFGFNIPSTATIIGVQVRYKHQEFHIDPSHGIFGLYIVKPDSSDAYKSSDLYTTKTTSTLGGINDMWGLSLTPEDINNDNFMVDASVESYEAEEQGALLYYLEVKISFLYNNFLYSDSIIVKTNIDDFTGHANLLLIDKTQSFQGHSSLLRIYHEYFTSEAKLLERIEHLFRGDSNLKRIVIRSFSGGSEIMTYVNTQFTGQAYLYDNESRFLYGPWLYGTIYGGIFAGATIWTSSFTSGASLSLIRFNQFSGRSNLKRIIPDVYSSDANLEKYIPRTFHGDTMLAEIKYGSFTGDSDLKRLIANSFSGYAFLDYPRFKSDANLALTIMRTFLADATFVKTYANTFTSDTYMWKERRGTFTSGSNLKTTIPESFLGDASIKEILSSTFTGDAKIQTRIDATYTGNTNLKCTVARTVTGNANLITTVISTFASDTIIVRVMSAQFTGDASIKSIEQTQFTSDSFFDAERVQVFAGEVILESIPQFKGFAGTVDCVRIASGGWGLTGMDEFGLELGI